MRAVGEMVLVKQVAKRKGESGLYLPETAKTEDNDLYQLEIEIIKMGATCPTDEIKVGDKVFLSKFSNKQIVGESIKISENEMHDMMFVHYGDIIGIDD